MFFSESQVPKQWKSDKWHLSTTPVAWKSRFFSLNKGKIIDRSEGGSQQITGRYLTTP
jgi:hypothetical protein